MTYQQLFAYLDSRSQDSMSMEEEVVVLCVSKDGENLTVEELDIDYELETRDLKFSSLNPFFFVKL